MELPGKLRSGDESRRLSGKFLWLRRVAESSQPLVGASAVSMIAKRALLRSGVPCGPLLGAHTFRHTVATEMVCRGVSFKEVADVLGHESLATTAIYAKLDLKALAQVAMPWAGGVR